MRAEGFDVAAEAVEPQRRRVGRHLAATGGAHVEQDERPVSRQPGQVLEVRGRATGSAGEADEWRPATDLVVPKSRAVVRREEGQGQARSTERADVAPIAPAMSSRTSAGTALSTVRAISASPPCDVRLTWAPAMLMPAVPRAAPTRPTTPG